MSKIGVTGMMCVPWMQMYTEHNQDVADSQRGTDLERKVEATFAFAEQVDQARRRHLARSSGAGRPGGARRHAVASAPIADREM